MTPHAANTCAVPSSLLVSELAATWRSRATELRRWAAAEGAACALEGAARELEAALRGQGEELLTLAQAARESGYSDEHVGRMVRMGKIPNAGRPSAPRVRRADLPKRLSRTVVLRGPVAYDAVADARSLASRR